MQKNYKGNGHNTKTVIDSFSPFSSVRIPNINKRPGPIVNLFCNLFVPAIFNSSALSLIREYDSFEARRASGGLSREPRPAETGERAGSPPY